MNTATARTRNCAPRLPAVDASPSLRNKKDLIEDFVDRVSVAGEIDEEWSPYVTARRTAELDRILIEEGSRPEETREFVARAFREGGIQAGGTAITRILPRTSGFAADGGHSQQKQQVLLKLGEFFQRFFGLAPVATNRAAPPRHGGGWRRCGRRSGGPRGRAQESVARAGVAIDTAARRAR